MARTKSAFRRVMTVRHLTWQVARLAVGTAPALAKPLNFYPEGVAAMAAGGEILENRTWREPLPFTDEMLRFVLENCARYDTMLPGHIAEDEATCMRWATLLPDAEIQGHTGSIVQPGRRRTITAHGTPPNWNFAKPALLRDGGRIAGRAFFTYRTDHYYHFLMDNALRLVSALEGGLADAASLTVVRHAGGGAVQDAFYAAAAARWPQLAVRIIGPRERVRADEVLWSARSATNYEWPPFDPAGVAVLAGSFRAAYGLGSLGERKRLVFLSRGGAKLRRLKNESVLIEAARARGFETLVARGDNHPDQVRQFSAARAVIAVHGAGLTNLLFAAPGTAVLEIFPKNFTKSTFAWMAARLGMRYQKLIGGAGDYDQAFTVDPAVFARALDALMADGSDGAARRMG